jgi:cytochrome c553
MKLILMIGISAAAGAAFAATDFSRPPPAWQVSLAHAAPQSTAQALIASGEGAAIACGGCHGAQGIPAAGVPFPRLAGSPAEYIAKQLFDYRDGNRPNAVMAPIAKALTDAQIGSLALYLGSRPVPAVSSAHASNGRGAQLAREGDNALALPACADCHGGDDVGGGPILPPLGGQAAAYTTAQLEAFRSGERHGDEGAVMREMSKRLSDADIAAIAAYFEGR